MGQPRTKEDLEVSLQDLQNVKTNNNKDFSMQEDLKEKLKLTGMDISESYFHMGQPRTR